MKKNWYGFFAFLIIETTTAATVNTNHAYCRWEGPYVGVNGGGAFARFNLKTSTTPGTVLDAYRTNIVNAAGNQNINPMGFITGVQAGYNWRFNHALLGLETDIQSLSINGNTNSTAVKIPNHPDTQFVISAYGNINWLFTARARLGWIVDPWMFYFTGGLALTPLQSDFAFTTNRGEFESQRVSQVKSGYVVGAGAETPLTNHISLRGEYLFLNFNDTNGSQMSYLMPPGQAFTNTVSVRTSIARLALNYNFYNNGPGLLDGWHMPNLLAANQWDVEVGTRLFMGSGIIGAPNPLYNAPGNLLASRLTYTNLAGITGETFARVDHTCGMFAKGYFGAGSITSGTLNDEDFPAGGAYSNTLSKGMGNLYYATIDLGFSALKNDYAKAGPFVGYNTYTENFNIYGCKQLAGAMVCRSPNLQNFIALSEEDTLASLRLGWTSTFALSDHLKLSAEAAYVPLVNFTGQDDHNARQLLGPESSNHGDGVMLESVLDYQLTNTWVVGVGARYSAWNMHNGSVLFDFLGTGEQIQEPGRYNAERYGVFVQLSYREKKPTAISLARSSAVCWRGFSIGAHLGGGWSDSDWSDPFGATLSPEELINKPGFGNKTHATGPLGGVSVKFDWQTNQWVYGIGVSVSAADMRGQNTLFSGLGGMNGEIVSRYVGTIVARMGAAFNRSLFYLNAGPAFLNSKYSINGNTTVMALGSQSINKTFWGWTVGTGLEFALTDHWTTSLEYNFINIADQTVAFSNVAIINQNRVQVDHRMYIVKVGLNYRFYL